MKKTCSIFSKPEPRYSIRASKYELKLDCSLLSNYKKMELAPPIELPEDLLDDLPVKPINEERLAEIFYNAREMSQFDYGYLLRTNFVYMELWNPSTPKGCICEFDEEKWKKLMKIDNRSGAKWRKKDLQCNSRFDLPDITRITVNGYRSIEQASIDLHHINILIGANGAGKSNFISLFTLIREIIQSRLQFHIANCGGAGTQFYLGTKHTETICVEIDFDKNTYQFKLAADTNDNCYFVKEKASFGIKCLYPGPYQENRGSAHHETLLWKSYNGRIVQNITRENIKSWFIYHFHDTGDHSPLKLTADIDDIAYLLPDGRNLAAYLYHLQESAPEYYQGILSAIQLILPGFKEFTYLKDEKSNTIKLRWKTVTSGDYTLPISAFSDGTLRFIALTTLFLQPAPPKLIIIDEPELGLHPYAINVLAELIHIASQKSQIILSTQSAQLISAFSPEDIIIVENKNGTTTIHPPTNLNSLKDWLTDYTLGDIWQSNIIGGNP